MYKIEYKCMWCLSHTYVLQHTLLLWRYPSICWLACCPASCLWILKRWSMVALVYRTYVICIVRCVRNRLTFCLKTLPKMTPFVPKVSLWFIANIHIRRVFVQGTIPKYFLISPYMRSSSWIQKNQGINTIHVIMVPHLKLFFICSITGLPWSSANICHTPGLPQARPHDAMHLPSIMHSDKGFSDDWESIPVDSSGQFWMRSPVNLVLNSETAI